MSQPAPRAEIERSLELTFEDSDQAAPAVTRNLSVTGMLALSEAKGQPGQFLRFDFEEFSGTGEVVWTREHEDGRTFMGVRFVTMSRGGKQALSKLVSEG